MKLRRLFIAAAVAAVTIVPASPALASHMCGIDGGTIDNVCQAHPENALDKFWCLISPTC